MTGIMQMFVGGSYSSAPVNTVAPAVTGTTTFGQTLSCSTGTWTGLPAPTFTYQWFRSPSTSIGGATSNTYTLVSADVGNTLYCRVTATNVKGAVNANSNTTATISAAVPSAPTIGTATATGSTTATVSYTASASNGGATITSYTAVSSPGGITGTLFTSGSGTITVSGLTPSTSYTFTVYATNSAGNSPSSSSSNSITTQSLAFIATLSNTTTISVANDVTVDSSGNVIAVGTYRTAAPANSARVQVEKYNSNGTLLWQRYIDPAVAFQNGSAERVITDASDNIYIVGSAYTASTNNPFFAKYNSSGTLLWQRYLSSTPYFGSFSGVTLDASGNIIATGSSTYPHAGSSAFGITTFSPSTGNTSRMDWDQTWLQSNGYGIAYQSSTTNVILVGQGTSSGSVRPFVSSWKTTGINPNIAVWWKFITNLSGGSFRAVAIDSSGNILVVGALAGPYIYILKCSSTGTLTWQRRIAGWSQASGFDVVADSSGNVYVAGYADTSSVSPEILIAKYDSSGTIQWQRTLGGTSTTASDYGYGIALDATGSNYYISGRGGASTSGGDIIVGKFPTDGSKTGTYTVGGYSYVYAASTFTESAATGIEDARSATVFNVSYTNSSASLTNGTSTLTSNVTTF